MRTITAALALTLIGCVPITAQAEPLNLLRDPQPPIVCENRASIVAHLAAKYDETTQVLGLSKDGVLMEITGSPDGDWTLLATRPDGTACVISAGKGLSINRPVPVGEAM